MRRVVTGVDQGGRSIIASDQDIAGHAFVEIPGMRETSLWATAGEGELDRSGQDPTGRLDDDLPGPGETRLHCVEFPPDEVFSSPDFDASAAAAEQSLVSPSLAALFEPASPGMHTTETTDYVFVLEGEICLELDDGVQVALRRGDTVVQNGTRHAWRNRSGAPAVLGVVNVGPPRS
jgi:uncharacterized cupin superfamily protein